MSSLRWFDTAIGPDKDSSASTHTFSGCPCNLSWTAWFGPQQGSSFFHVRFDVAVTDWYCQNTRTLKKKNTRIFFSIFFFKKVKRTFISLTAHHCNSLVDQFSRTWKRFKVWRVVWCVSSVGCLFPLEMYLSTVWHETKQLAYFF